MDPNHFDALTRSLSEARSRRGLLRTLAATALGGLGLAGLARGATAAPGSPDGNSAAAAFCHTLFGNTRAAGQCTSQAAHGQGLYSACKGDPNNYCDEACTNIQTDTSNCGSCDNVCSGGDACNTPVCVNGTCDTAPLTGGACTVNGQPGTCQSGTCVQICTSSFNGVCDSPPVPTCLGNPNCMCGTTTEGDIDCFSNSVSGTGGSCTSSDTCPPGQRCWNAGCYGQHRCINLCSGR